MAPPERAFPLRSKLRADEVTPRTGELAAYTPSPMLPRALLLPMLAASFFGCGKDADKGYPQMPPELIGGAERPAALYVPSDYSRDKAYPLVVMLHGYSATGTLQDFIFGLRERVTRDQFVLVVPEGTRNSRGKQFWNAFPECCDFEGSGVDDVGYLSALVEEAASVVHVDRARITSAGHSNGGYMSFRLVCERPDLVRRAISIAGSMPVDPEHCPKPGSVSILHAHGSLDDVVPYADNREGSPGAGHGIVSRGAHDTVERFRVANGCSETPDSEEALDLLSNVEGAETTVRVWKSCATGERVEFWDSEGGDHLYLGRTTEFQDRIAEFITARR